MFVIASIAMFFVRSIKMYQSICILFFFSSSFFLSFFLFNVLAVDAPRMKETKDCDKSVLEH